MCKGAMEESKIRAGSCRIEPDSAAVRCALCESRASLYCQADDAYLCRKCDQWVHGANFLAKRHVRCVLCNSCQKLTQRYCVGVSAEVVLPSLVGSSGQRGQCENPGSDPVRPMKRPFLLL